MREAATMKKMLFTASLALLLPGLASGQVGTWTTDAGVGSSSLAVTIQVSCPTTSFVCNTVNGYADSQNSTLSGSGGLVVDTLASSLRFETDGNEDWGLGPQPVYNLLSGTGMTFVNIPFAGVPEIASLVVFATADSLIAVPGFIDLLPGDYAFSQTIPYASLVDIIGDLELNLPDIVMPPQNVVVTGSLHVLGDIDLDTLVEYELRNLSAVLTVLQPGNIGGEPVAIAITSALNANLSGEVAGPVAVPALGSVATLLLAGGLALMGIRKTRIG